MLHVYTVNVMCCHCGGANNTNNTNNGSNGDLQGDFPGNLPRLRRRSQNYAVLMI